MTDGAGVGDPRDPPPYVFSDDDDETGLTPAKAAATSVVFHEDPALPAPRLLMVVRSKAMAFAAGAAVFPGGRVDPDDAALAARVAPELSPADGAARVAAVRETIEETGLGIGLEAAVDAALLEAIREGLLNETPFSELLDRHGVRLALDALVPFARWRPNFAHSRVFDTRFYLARIEGALPALSTHAPENSALFWMTAQEALERADAGDIDVIFPTRRNLERLARYGSFEAAVAHAREVPARRITPWIAQRGGEQHLCIREDCGYPVTSEPAHAAMRG